MKRANIPMLDEKPRLYCHTARGLVFASDDTEEFKDFMSDVARGLVRYYWCEKECQASKAICRMLLDIINQIDDTGHEFTTTVGEWTDVVAQAGCYECASPLVEGGPPWRVRVESKVDGWLDAWKKGEFH